ncbi:MAG TPA: fumarylacetoacetate hydrolase family protein [Magnetovibrio sp.]
MFPKLTASQVLPADGYAGTLLGRALYPGVFPGPCVVVIREDGVHNISGTVPTMAALLNAENPLALVHKALKNCVYLGRLEEILENSTPSTHNPLKPYLLTPIDLQAVKAVGLTFVGGLLERVAAANGGDALVHEMEEAAGTQLSKVRPNTDEAARVREVLEQKGLWDHALEVGFGPDVELFTKTQPLSSVGTGAEIGMHPASTQTFAEPEVVLLIAPDGKIRGVTLGVDMTLCDVEKRSPLLLGRAKEHNATCAVGPFIRLFDRSFSLPNVQGMKLTYSVEAEDGAVFSDTGSMDQISRGLLTLVRQVVNEHHGYPDGVALFTGCMFKAPATRGGDGEVFTHKIGDVVTIKAPPLGTLINRVNTTDKVRPWNFGISDLMINLANRQLLG